jgi:hypothetical protein
MALPIDAECIFGLYTQLSGKILGTKNRGLVLKPGSCIRNRHESTKRKERGTYAKEA